MPRREKTEEKKTKQKQNSLSFPPSKPHIVIHYPWTDKPKIFTSTPKTNPKNAGSNAHRREDHHYMKEASNGNRRIE